MKKKRKKEECEEKVTATHRSTNPFDVFIFPHVPPPYHHYPVAELQALKVDPDLNCSPPRRPTAPPARPSALPARPAVPSAIPTAPHPQAAAAGGQEEEEDPEIIP
ncbi:Filamentous hemagglutinin [Labeo rohita]|uniref:Filamentous hemagglutinin n=1 Tax=Labeo rohita TaxID=84645 RepID=A0ABQ8MFM0_LABRO|nr:Filamentous hemagglutinin [Labeo rohita]